MYILVTGGCGFIGTPLTQKLLERGYKISIIDTLWFGNHLQPHKNLEVHQVDLRNTDDISLKGVDIIIHLGGIANDPSVELDPALSWEVNVLATMRLADKAARSGVKQFIFASSGSIYGVKDEPEVTEELPPTPISTYNKTKMVAERVLMSYKEQMLVQCLRPGTVCGYSPRMRMDVLANMLTIEALTQGEITICGGAQQRPLLHMDDMINAYLHMIDQGNKLQGIYNVGYGNISVLDAAKKVAGLTAAKLFTKETNDPRSYRMNSDKIIATGFKFTKTIDNAVEEVIEAYRAGLVKDEDQCYNVRWMRKTLGVKS